ncbi:hypothetical protein AWENTII_002684 [Aspergillus wentii]
MQVIFCTDILHKFYGCYIYEIFDFADIFSKELRSYTSNLTTSRMVNTCGRIFGLAHVTCQSRMNQKRWTDKEMVAFPKASVLQQRVECTHQDRMRRIEASQKLKRLFYLCIDDR